MRLIISPRRAHARHAWPGADSDESAAAAKNSTVAAASESWPGRAGRRRGWSSDRRRRGRLRGTIVVLICDALPAHNPSRRQRLQLLPLRYDELTDCMRSVADPI